MATACLTAIPAHAIEAVTPTFATESVTKLASAVLPDASSNYLSDLGSGIVQAFSLIFFSEIGDKTFFMAGIVAARTSRLLSFIGSMGALSVMTLLCVLIGQIFHAIPSGLTGGLPFDDVAAALAFAYFGISTLTSALEAKDGEGGKIEEELKDAEEETDALQFKSDNLRIIGQTFLLVFAAEVGDRSFLSTIALSAAQNPVGVFFGGIAGHAIATIIAVTGGSFIAKYLSERVIGIIGGSLFLTFAFTTTCGLFGLNLPTFF